MAQDHTHTWTLTGVTGGNRGPSTEREECECGATRTVTVPPEPEEIPVSEGMRSVGVSMLASEAIEHSYSLTARVYSIYRAMETVRREEAEKGVTICKDLAEALKAPSEIRRHRRGADGGFVAGGPQPPRWINDHHTHRRKSD